MKVSKLHILSVLTAVVVLAGCQQKQVQAEPRDAWGIIRIPQGQGITIRVAVSQTDHNIGPVGIEQRRGAELAARQFDTIQGFPVNLEISDPVCSSEGGVNAAHDASFEAQTAAVIGMTCSSSCLASAPILDDAHMLEISPSCEASSLTDPVTQREIFFTTSFGALDEGQVSADFAVKEMGASRIAIITYNNSETTDVVDAFKTQAAGLGATIVNVSNVAMGQSTFEAAINVTAESRPDIIYAPLLPTDAVTLAKQHQSSRLKDIPLLGGRYYLSQWFIDEAGAGADGVYAVGPNINNAQSADIANSYTAAYRQAPTSSEAVFSYDAMRLVLEGIKKVAVLSSDNTLLIGRQALRNTILQTASYQAASGPITCTTWGDCSAPGTLLVAHVRAGKWVNVFIP